MFLKKLREIEGVNVFEPNARLLQTVISIKESNSCDFSFLVSTIYPGGGTGSHIHDDSGELMFFIQGHGKAIVEGESFPVEAEDILYSPPGERHEIRNIGNEELKIACFFNPSLPGKYASNEQNKTKTL